MANRTVSYIETGGCQGLSRFLFYFHGKEGTSGHVEADGIPPEPMEKCPERISSANDAVRIPVMYPPEKSIVFNMLTLIGKERNLQDPPRNSRLLRVLRKMEGATAVRFTTR